MKILYLSQKPFYPLRIAHGGQRSTHDLLRAIQENTNSQCYALCLTAIEYVKEYQPPTYHWESLGITQVNDYGDRVTFDCGYKIDAFTGPIKDYWYEVNRICDSFKPDVIVTGQRGAIEIVRFAHGKGIPVIWNIDTSPQQGIYEINDLIDAAGLNTSFVCCSYYVKDRILELTYGQIEPQVVYPPMDKSIYHVERIEPTYLTVINPVEVKGGNILPEIVSSFPSEQFLFVIGWEFEQGNNYWSRFREIMQKYPNVNVIERTPDIRTVFAQSKLLLVPSQWDEALGRVVWEAQCSGIPSVVSAVGGLPEVLGSGGEFVEDYTQPRAWIDALQDILHKPNRLDKLYAAAQASAQRTYFASEVSVDTFLKVVHDRCNNYLGSDWSQTRFC